MDFSGLQLSLPPGYAQTEISVTLHAPLPPSEGRLLQKQTPIHENLIVQRKQAPPGASLGLLVAGVEQDLKEAFDGLREFESKGFDFDDGVAGHLISFRFDFGEADQVRQFHALRLDDETFTNLTLTVDGLKLDADKLQSLLRCLAATRRKI